MSETVVKRMICLSLALLLALCAGCGKKEATKKKKKVVIKKVIPAESTPDTAEDEPSSVPDFSYEDNTSTDWEDIASGTSSIEETLRARRELASTGGSAASAYVPEFTRKTVDWNGPRGWVIVYKSGDEYSRLSARYLQAFFKKVDGVTLTITDDSAAARDKEILVGDTNRYKTSLGEQEFAVNLKGNKLIFEGGHRTMVEKAVKWFMSIDRVSGKVATLKGSDKTFKSTVSGGYKLVWNEEFDGDFLDKTKFIFCQHMTVNKATNAGDFDDERLVRVEEGKLKMSVAHYFSEFNSSIDIGVPKAVCTGDTMNWQYGYIEMRALLPMHRGGWPGWWAQTYCLDHEELYPSLQTSDYGVEVDFFEGGGTNTIVPNIHKWYESSGQYVWKTDLFDELGNRVTHSGYRDMGLSVSPYNFPLDTVDEYHILGVRWTPEELTLIADGNEYTTFDLTNNYDGYTSMDGFREPLHMIINVFAYIQGLNETNANNSCRISDLPLDYFIDYVRIYQRDGEGFVKNMGLQKTIEY